MVAPMGRESVTSNSGSMVRVISPAGKKVRRLTAPLVAMGPAIEWMRSWIIHPCQMGPTRSMRALRPMMVAYSETISKTFILNFPPTPTPTITNTPTATPLPSCNDVFIIGSDVNNNSNSSDFRVSVRNNNQSVGFLTSSRMTWDSLYSPPLYFDYFWFLNTRSENRYYNPSPSNWYDSTHPIISWSDSAGAPTLLAGECQNRLGRTL